MNEKQSNILEDLDSDPEIMLMFKSSILASEATGNDEEDDEEDDDY